MNKMRDDQEFNINFVKIVQKYRCLFDKTMPEYRSKDDHERIWNKVAQEAKESVSHCKERWRNLRACLTRHLKNNQRQSGYHKPYYLADHMEFLLPYTRTRSPKSAEFQKSDFVEYMIKVKKQRQSEDNDDDDHDENDNLDADDDENEVLDKDYQEDADEETGDRNTYEDESFSTEVLIEKKLAAPIVTIPIEAITLNHTVAGSSSVNGEVAKIENKPRTSGIGNKRKAVDSEIVESYQTEAKRLEISSVDAKEIEDADINFFKSLLPDIRQLNASQKRRFKMGILELIDNICETQ